MHEALKIGKTVGRLLQNSRRTQPPMGIVSVNWRPIHESYGGMNVFVQQFVRSLTDRGFKTRYDLKGHIDVIVIAHPWMTHDKPYGFEDVVQYKKRYPNTVVILRVNECDKRKATNHVDRWLEQWSRIADFSVFISGWLRNHHAETWFDRDANHAVIQNGADSRIFHPLGGARFEKGQTLRLVTHHWAGSRVKGFDDYEEIDRLISDGVLKDTELVVIGRWPEDIKWRSTQLYSPRTGRSLATILRSCHAYVTGSRWEPGGMHFIEGAQCGLPVIYHEDGGGIPEIASQFGISYRSNIVESINQMREDYSIFKEKVLVSPPSGDKMCQAFVDTIQKLLAQRDASPSV